MVEKLSPVRSLDAVTLTAARTIEEVNTEGTFIHCVSASEPFLIALNKGGDTVELAANRFYQMPRGDDGQPVPFTSFLVKRKATAAVASNAISLIVGSGDYRDGNAAVREQVATVLNGSAADVAVVASGGANATLLIAASTILARKGVKVRNTGALPLRIAGMDADAKAGTKGDYVAAGESVYYPCCGALYASSVGGAGTAAVVELQW